MATKRFNARHGLSVGLNPIDVVDETGQIISGTRISFLSNPVITTDQPLFNANQTWNNAATPFTSFRINVTDTASNASSKLMDLQVGGVSKLSVDKVGNLVVAGDLTVQGTTITMNTAVVDVEDSNITLGKVASPTNATANGGGITLLGTTNKTIIWDSTNANWTSSEHWNLAPSAVYKINNVNVLSSTTLGSSVVNSSLTSVGTLTAGTWNASIIAGQYGGTGVANTGKTITLGGNLTTAGAFATTLTVTGTTNVTLPTTGTLATLAGAETLTNKTISGALNTLTAIGNASLVNSSVTIGSTPIALGATVTSISGLTSVTSTSFVGNASTATSIAGQTQWGILYQSAPGVTASTTQGTAKQVLASNGAAAPTYQTLNMTYIPDAAFKESVNAATTADLAAASATATTLTGPLVPFPAQDGVASAVNNRYLVKDQTNPAQNGIYKLTTLGVTGTTAWVLTRDEDANTSSKIAGSVVNVDAGTVNGGKLFKTNFKPTDIIGTTSIRFSEIADVSTVQTLTNKTLSTGSNWNGNIIAGQYGGTGVANTGKTITLGGNLTTAGAFATTLTVTGTTNVTLPTTGTLATLAGAETLTNKTLTTPLISSIYGSNAASGTLSLSSTSNATKGTITIGDANAGTLTIQAATTNIKVGAAASSGFLKVAATTGLVSIDTSTYLTANQPITLSGDITGTGSTAITTAIGANKVTLGMMAQVATGTILGRITAATGNVEALTGAQAKSVIGLGLVENTALSTWPGTSNITTVGTITTGVWNASVIADGKIASALTGKTYNGLSLAPLTAGFTIAGGMTTSKMLTVGNTLGLFGVDGSTLNIGAGGVLGSAAFTNSTAYATAAHTHTTLASPTFTGTVTLPGIKNTIASKISAYTLTTTDNVILADASTAGFTLTLPLASGNAGLTLVIKKIDSSVNSVLITSSDLIDGTNTVELGQQYESLTLISSGTTWYII